MRIPLIFLVLLPLLAAGCASQQSRYQAPLLIHHGPVMEVPDVDMLAVSPEMQAFLDRYVMKFHDRDVRMRSLATAVIDQTMLGFDYQDELTLTAAEAFEAHSGNCVGFANLMVALAREAGLRANYQEIVRETDWSSQNETILVATHVNAIMFGNRDAVEVDTSGLEYRRGVHKRRMGDHEVAALYYNNLGAEALLDYDLSRAYAYFQKAIETAPRMADPWVNLGVALGRNWQVEDAITAYRTALELDPRQYSAMSNLYDLYLSEDRLAEAAELAPAIDRYKRRNPYILLKLAEESLEQEDFQQALELLDRALDKKEEEHLFHYARARTLYLAGDPGGAETSLDRARELAPEELVAHYQRPLAELAIEP
jgi:Flp pilus assembly protein TadD